MATIFEKLRNPLPPEKVSWRVGQVTKANPKKASALCYIDARDVMERFDEVVGPGDWEDKYEETARGRIFCTISIRIMGHWVSKTDAAGDTAVEADKGAVSDAFKRAAVKWGVGRYLYDIPIQWVAINEYKQIEKGEHPKLQKALPGSIVYADDDVPAPKAAPKETPPKADTKSAPPPPSPPNPPESGLSEDWQIWMDDFKSQVEATIDYLGAGEIWNANSKPLNALKKDHPQTFKALSVWMEQTANAKPKVA